MMPPIRPEATRRLTWAILIFVAVYGVWAIGLSVWVINRQQVVRQHLWAALHYQPTQRFPTPAQATRAGQQFVRQLNDVYAQNPCGPGPAYVFVTGPSPPVACVVTVAVQDRRLRVTGYDTQGLPMDSIYEALYPPPRRLD
ncbi:MAG: hypothetical protein ACYCXG_07425 [Acidiferrobacter sp.]